MLETARAAGILSEPLLGDIGGHAIVSFVTAKRLFLVGGGHAHALVLRHWADVGAPTAEITLINPGPSAAYSGMFPGFVAGHYARAELDIDLAALCARAGVRFVDARASAIDATAGQLHVDGQGWQTYDVMSLDIGVTAEMPDLPGASEHAFAAKPLDRMADAWARFVGQIERGEAMPAAAVIGGGVAGAELVMALAHRLGQVSPQQQAQLQLVEAGPDILRELPARARATVMRALSRLGVRIHTNTAVSRILADAVDIATGERLPSAFTALASGARPHPWLADSGLALNTGFVTVGETLASTSHPNVFATGDCAHLSHAPRPKAGVFAVRQAPVLAHNLVAALAGEDLRSFQPQSDYLKLISLGRKSAVATKWGLSVSGPWAWRLKDRIDRRFTAGFGA